MIKIRYGIFETNSSSTHSLCVAQNDEIEKLKCNELLVNLSWKHSGFLISYDKALKELINYFNEYGGYPEEKEAIARGDKEEIYRLLYEYDIAERFDDYLRGEYLEPYKVEFTTQSGDKVLIFGRYGHD